MAKIVLILAWIILILMVFSQIDSLFWKITTGLLSLFILWLWNGIKHAKEIDDKFHEI